MTTTLRFGDWAAMQADAKPIRMEVFVQEQNVPADLEMDDRDAACLHAVAYDAGGKPLGTGRLLPDGHIGRMAVLRSARGAGIGGAILKGLMEKARGRGDQKVVLSAQTHAAEFYLAHGFAMAGDVFYEAGIPHIEMHYEF
ncbi:GNAT family N-acetyltransferase [Duganella sp. Root1480D1]|uniref:GNAT family N-acetyltransferase n=1 Tax=Duganella sp. Root1480D1 TaxID=1736471 RepID=UPI00070FE261|nr:GNAT family N-acetyltransferase [Duganella sp. Root1480D1]KQZ28295.1 GCN5 family acetyltransferase [Duganella sp. Root1480D1]